MSEKTCEYVAKWKYDEDRDMIDFEIQSKHIDKWTGIGFSETPQMVINDGDPWSAFCFRLFNDGYE